MDIDFASHLGAVDRAVSSSEREGRPTRSVTLARSLGTTIEDLWDAVTNAERIVRWFLPVAGDLQAGGRYQLEGNAGGLITECERPSRFALTWEFAGDVSWVEVRLTEAGDGRARIALTHTAHLSPHWDEYGPGAAGVGWEMGLMGLAIHVEQPDAPMPDEEAFAASPEGRAYITGSSEGWAQAAIDAGEDADAARGAAKRTAAFYTGEAPETA